MTLDELERLEQTAMSLVVQALLDYRHQAVTIFQEETDSPQDIAEDLTREAMDLMGVPGLNERLYGKVDFKKAIYIFLPAAWPVALMLDSKAEKSNGDRTATIQMSQTSMRVRMHRGGRDLDEPGGLEQVITRGGRDLHVVTIIAKYVYEESTAGQELRRVIVSCIPNGLLQDRYNPNANDGIWLAGRNAPTLGEDFRVRLSFERLSARSPWRVQEIPLNQGGP
jgi:hypothetical protein